MVRTHIHTHTHTHTHTQHCTGFKQAEEDIFAEAKKRNILVQFDSGCSLVTADIVRRIIENRLQFEERNRKKSQKEVDRMESQGN